MQRIDLHKSTLNPNFIGSWMMEPASLCDGLVNYFESHQERQKRGAVGGGVNSDYKKSTDISVAPNEVNLPGNEVFNEYFKCLFDCHKDYLAQWPFLREIAENIEIGGFNLQRYHSGEHFQKLHTERFNLSTLHRVLAWMTYLNDVDEGGSTYFSHYDIEVQPRRGLTLIWPAEWTHAHKGRVINAGSKYIITGWMHFPE
ncbi:MAG: 2OG-Fe(II) oxygenase [Gammaproteobacteria bacterium]|nr:2OG-Fe(II) oxygenase [Gammaproteobacteria bacterium]